MANKTITVKLKKSTIRCNDRVKATVRGLGLRKTGTSKTLENTSAVRGMIKKVIHLLEVQE
ncbi:MAG: 50S ribosomal protein L30 [Halobacteriovorax sp.]|nr:50S ribosomal protein L30 [Halobacteriovorax sp.]|tara:strand:- start:172 stop:354 length:183 start_codon:yes stop_codon:yes gene_type:complete